MTFMPTSVGKTKAPPVQSKCGPFACARDWLLAIARDDMSFQRERNLRDEERSWMLPVVADVMTAPLTYLDNDESSIRSPWSINVLLHVDLGLHNIMVDSNDPTVITGVIDWEGACVVPLWSILPFFLNEMRSYTPEYRLAELEELRSLMKHSLLEAVPEWAKLVAEGVEARTLHARAKLSIGNPKYAGPSDHFFLLENMHSYLVTEVIHCKKLYSPFAM
ncbi:hypothetical protein JB92DRAFT_1979820 [Gautieria morchelliformis]|nr:hypothetical protein JB92DRAFT_1979820 [Gautieria morchelliformis]